MQGVCLSYLDQMLDYGDSSRRVGRDILAANILFSSIIGASLIGIRKPLLEMACIAMILVFLALLGRYFSRISDIKHQAVFTLFNFLIALALVL